VFICGLSLIGPARAGAANIIHHVHYNCHKHDNTKFKVYNHKVPGAQFKYESSHGYIPMAHKTKEQNQVMLQTSPFIFTVYTQN
jgi:hypothetical protein